MSSQESSLNLFEDKSTGPSSEGQEDGSVDQRSDRYLFFQLGDVTMASPLMEIREVIETVSYQTMPNTVPYFKGIANIRGEVVGIVDLSEMLNIKKMEEEREALIVFDTVHGALALLVGKVKGVQSIEMSAIEQKPHIKSRVPQGYLFGIAKVNDELISVIELQKILTDDDMITMRKEERA